MRSAAVAIALPITLGACSYPFSDFVAPSDGSATTSDAMSTSDGATSTMFDATVGDGASDASTVTDASTATDAAPPLPIVECSSSSYPGTICVPGSTFTLGATSTSACGGTGCPSELPDVTVTVSQFALDAKEVTVGDFKKFVAAGLPTPASGTAFWPYGKPKDHANWQSGWPSAKAPGTAADCTYAAGDDALPINCVDWYTALAYCIWNGAKRLPTEAEWEAEASGAEERLFPWSSASTENMALPTTVSCDCAQSQAPTCGTLSARLGDPRFGISKHGAFDMAGRVAEWTLDAFTGSTGWSSLTSNTDPLTKPRATEPRSVRGGNYQSPIRDLRAASRFGFDPASSLSTIGFRCAQRN